MPDLRTERLVIRAPTLADLDDLHRILDVELGEGLSRTEREDRIRWTIGEINILAALLQPAYADRVLVRLADNVVIGSCGLVASLGPFGLLPTFADVPQSQRSLRQPEVGLYYALAPAARGQGYATEAARALIDYAFHALRVRRVIATTLDDNEASRAVMRRLGMRLERNPEPEPPWFRWVGVIENPAAPRT
jgi:ribosomal-protein-alanine N-acetyltransferase